MSVSIIIPAYKAEQFIDECIDSIQKQVVPFDYEVLIGIDACPITLEHMKKRAYANNIRIFYFDYNCGPFVVKNSLTRECKYDKLLFFDADDVMNLGTLIVFNTMIENYQLVRLPYINFHHGRGKEKYAPVKDDAVFGVQKHKFEQINGFYPWVCSADTEFTKRAIETHKWSNTSMPGVAYMRRLHENNLTVHPNTNFESRIRKNYDDEIRKTRRDPLSKIIQPYTHVENINA